MASLLLDNGADPNRCYWTMAKPVGTAANHQGKAIFRMLLKAGAEYTLYETVALGFLKLTRELLDQDTDAVNALDDGALPIVQAAQDVKMTRVLLRYGADPNGQDSRGVTALMEASQAGANPNEEQQHRWMQDSPLVTAVSHRHEHLVSVLLDYGADVNPPRAFKWSIPLTAAVRWGTYAGVEMLLDVEGGQ